MTVKDELSLLTPRLRRYARALTQAAPGPSELADELVHATLLRARDTAPLDREGDVTTTAFAFLTQLHRDSLLQHRTRMAGAGRDGASAAEATQSGPELQGANRGLCEGLASLKLDEREALLLVAVEHFTYAQAMQILHLSRASLIARLIHARARLTEALSPARADGMSSRRPPYLRLVK